KIKKENKNVIITGIKLVEEINTFKKYFKHNFHLIFIQANEKTRYCRLINQNEKKDPKIRPDSINQMTNEKKLSEFEKLEQISELQIKCSITLEQLKKDTNKIIQKLLFLNDPKKAHIINEKTLYNGKIFETITQEWVIESNNNKTNTINIEIVRRSPGVRAIAIKDNKILLNREYRLEHDGFDYRLPGGKVFDTLEEYTDKSDTDIIKHASDAVKKELLEEAGLVAKTVNYINCTKAGATIIWDLYYFEIPDFEISKNGKNLEENEIIHSEWKSLDEVEQMCINGDIQEDRSIGVLLRYLKKTSSK
ncbi:MAG: NUDIX domain-containing protein, partial [Candidatus Diapherotrites archaeon]|nr:NUDIX domain-containing protein [Candidatus Diapherotrites archaeon]